MLGKKVIGIWGGLYPKSYGEITEIKDGLATIEWAQHDYCAMSVEKLDNIKSSGIEETGIYFA